MLFILQAHALTCKPCALTAERSGRYVIRAHALSLTYTQSRRCVSPAVQACVPECASRGTLPNRFPCICATGPSWISRNTRRTGPLRPRFMYLLGRQRSGKSFGSPRCVLPIASSRFMKNLHVNLDAKCSHIRGACFGSKITSSHRWSFAITYSCTECSA